MQRSLKCHKTTCCGLASHFAILTEPTTTTWLARGRKGLPEAAVDTGQWDRVHPKTPTATNWERESSSRNNYLWYLHGNKHIKYIIELVRVNHYRPRASAISTYILFIYRWWSFSYKISQSSYNNFSLRLPLLPGEALQIRWFLKVVIGLYCVY
jgi:hypothetical protein